MSEDGSVTLGSGRRWWRALLTLACVVAVVLASVTLPLFVGGGTTAPAAQFNFDQPLSGESSAAGGTSAGGLGALSPPDRMRVGSSSSEINPYSELNRDVHFVVKSDTPSYWRTGTYDAYTGQGWQQTGESTPLSRPIPVEGAPGERVNYEVTLERPARSLPTVWRPRTLSLDRDSLRLEPGRSVSSRQPVPAGTSYTAESVAPPDDPDLLQTAGTDYPDEVATTYTALPDHEGTARVANFTDDLTADTDTPYETARQIESWLEANREYSLNATHDPENGTITSEFLFGMDRGYCEYFATAMTTMLRTQDVPARYVVGYATGEQTGDDEYTVRGMHAHAWVEVYFPDVGWVRFDPTPAAERTEQEQEALGETPTTELTPTETAVTVTVTATGAGDGTATGAKNGTTTEPGTGDGTEIETPSPTATPTTTDTPLKLSLNRTAVPGATVEVTVTRGGDPVTDAEVLFNGEPIGRTDTNGSVVGQVPYAERLDVTVRTDTAGALPPPDAAAYAVGNYGFTAANNTSYSLDTNASVSLAGEVRSDATVTLVATVDGVPVRDATVRLNGEQVGRTGDRGGIELRLPSDPGEYEYVVERGSVRGERNVTIHGLELNHSVGWPVTVPFAPVTLNATLDGEPISDATVTIGGKQAGTTNGDGIATLRLPATDSVTLAVTAHGQRAEAEITGLFATLGGLLAGLLVGGVGLFGGAYRRGVGPRDAVGLVTGTLLRGCRLLLIGVISLAATLSHGVGAAADTLARAAERLVELLRELRARSKTPREVADIVLEGVVVWVRAVTETLRSLPATLGALVSGAAEGGPAGDSPASSGDETPEDPETAAARERIRVAWGRFLTLLPVRGTRTLTPGEIARIAVEDANLPAGPVERLRDAYREVSYGDADPTSRQTAVEDAVESLDDRTNVNDGTDEEDATNGGESA